MKARARPVAAISSASFWRPAPSMRERKFPEPCPQKKPKAWMTAMAEKHSPTAAVASVEIRPTKNVSAALYSAVTSMLSMVGTASFRISCGTGVSVRRRRRASEAC